MKRQMPTMKSFLAGTLFLAVLIHAGLSGSGFSSDIGDAGRDYVAAWKQFYPTAAFAAGDKASAFRFEDYSRPTIDAWIAFQKNTLERIKETERAQALDDRIDLRLLERQALWELEKWQIDQAAAASLSTYSDLLAGSLVYVLMRSDLTAAEKQKAVTLRLAGIRRVCGEARAQLRNGRPESAQTSLRSLEASARFIEKTLPDLIRSWWSGSWEDLSLEAKNTAQSIGALSASFKAEIFPRLSLKDDLGHEAYARKLRIYSGLDLTPERLAEMALEEIGRVRTLIGAASGEYWKERYPADPFPAEFKILVDRTFADMERDRVGNEQDFLQIYKDLARQAEDFVKANEIATLPPKRTLLVSLSPEQFEGWGGVSAPGPFNADAETLFNLPHVSDQAPGEARDAFYRSFNNHFNTIIVPHELFPGHYVQLKWASASPRILRALFSDEVFVEGWATLCEMIMLDAGWGGFHKLDRLAFLRKRLENATRAYVSVQMHCFGWTKEKIRDFAVDQGLLPPQFAIYLWPRTINNPFQLVSYFLGSQILRDGLAGEKARLGERFRIRNFCDALLRSGGFPLAELPSVLAQNR